MSTSVGLDSRESFLTRSRISGELQLCTCKYVGTHMWRCPHRAFSGYHLNYLPLFCWVDTYTFIPDDGPLPQDKPPTHRFPSMKRVTRSSTASRHPHHWSMDVMHHVPPPQGGWKPASNHIIQSTAVIRPHIQLLRYKIDHLSLNLSFYWDLTSSQVWIINTA